MLTVMEAMKLKALKGTMLIAGKQGENRAIKWVTTIEIIEDISRFQEGEFIVTTGYGLRDNPLYKNRLIELMKTNKPSAIALYTGFYMDSIPKELIHIANLQGLPLIEIPSSINFSTITKGIVEQIGN